MPRAHKARPPLLPLVVDVLIRRHHHPHRHYHGDSGGLRKSNAVSLGKDGGLVNKKPHAPAMNPRGKSSTGRLWSVTRFVYPRSDARRVLPTWLAVHGSMPM